MPYSPQAHAEFLDRAPPFDPVPFLRQRHDGWTQEKQRMFLAALAATGTVGTAARLVGMTRKSAYDLRLRDGAQSFAEAWEIAVGESRARAFDVLMDRALNGVTTVKIRMGGAVDIGHGADQRIAFNALRPHAAPPNLTKVT
jgi:hypothetical protein